MFYNLPHEQICSVQGSGHQGGTLTLPRKVYKKYIYIYIFYLYILWKGGTPFSFLITVPIREDTHKKNWFFYWSDH